MKKIKVIETACAFLFWLLLLLSLMVLFLYWVNSYSVLLENALLSCLSGCSTAQAINPILLEFRAWFFGAYNYCIFVFGVILLQIWHLYKFRFSHVTFTRRLFFAMLLMIWLVLTVRVGMLHLPSYLSHSVSQLPIDYGSYFYLFYQDTLFLYWISIVIQIFLLTVYHKKP